MTKTIIVSNRLPIKIQEKEDKLIFTQSEGGLATGLASVFKNKDNLWVGWPGLEVEDERKKASIIKDLKESNLHPIFLSQEEIEGFYEGFSNGTLWPTFHYFSQYATYKQSNWEYYVEVNQKFCDEILQYMGEKDVVWIQDYQLLLLPQLIRKKRPEATIGFFQHIPFPSYEVFRLLPWRKEILSGMLGADLIGFHTYDDMRHFLSSVNRISGKRNVYGKIHINKRMVLVDSFPMGIDYQKYAKIATSEETLAREVRYRASLGETKVMLSIDRLDYSKGIPERLEAFERFLEKYPEFIEKVTFLMLVVPSRDRVGRYKQLKETIDEMVGRINGKYGQMNWNPIHYFYRSFAVNSLSALYRLADVALVTPMRDGMNLVCKEYVASKLNKKGVLILSEMAGASKELPEALLINPNNTKQVTDAMYTALNMPEDEQMLRMTNSQKVLKKYNIHHWINMFMASLKQIKSEYESMATYRLNAIKSLAIAEKYNKANRRLIFLDYDGTLVPFYDNPQKAEPDEELLDILSRLSQDKRNKVIIVSGRDKITLSKWLGRLPIGLIAEHGVWHRVPNHDWTLLQPLDKSWKSKFKPVIETFVNRTPGSFIEEKEYSLVWHFRKVDTGLAELRSAELANHLEYLSAGTSLQILEGNMVLEIKNSEINKGKAAKLWLENNHFDFVAALGDDWTDEDLFLAMPEGAHTVKVGNKHSVAEYNLSSSKEVRIFLSSLLELV